MVQLVSDLGYTKVTVRKLTRLAGVSPSAFYSQFDGKEECFVDTYGAVMANVRERLAAARRPDDDRNSQLSRALKALWEGLGTDVEATRLALVEAFAGGPAALQRIRVSETTIEAALRECLERREARVSPVAVSWIAAGVLRSARTRALAGACGRLGASLERWAATYLDEEAPDFRGRRAKRLYPRLIDSSAPSELEPVPPLASDRELIVARTLRLARVEGYWCLTTTKIRQAAGLSATRFNREFSDVEGCYLAAMRHLANYYFGPPPGKKGSEEEWTATVHFRLRELCRKVAADPDLAKLLFLAVLDPGLEGMRCREELVAEIAAQGRRLIPKQMRPADAEATVAALWSFVAAELEAGRGGSLHHEAQTCTFLVLAPVLGVDSAAVAVEREGQREHSGPRRTQVAA
jgi:AcrR family transcriptional regulator